MDEESKFTIAIAGDVIRNQRGTFSVVGRGFTHDEVSRINQGGYTMPGSIPAAVKELVRLAHTMKKEKRW